MKDIRAIAIINGCYNAKMKYPIYRKSLIIMRNEGMKAKDIQKYLNINGSKCSTEQIYKWFQGRQPRDHEITILEKWIKENERN